MDNFSELLPFACMILRRETLRILSRFRGKALKDEVKGYDINKGTIGFPADKPLPFALVRKLVRLRIAKNRG